MNRLLSFAKYLTILADKRVSNLGGKRDGGRGGLMSAHVYLSLWFVLELLQKGVLLALSSQAIHEAFANWLRVACVMELAVD